MRTRTINLFGVVFLFLLSTLCPAQAYFQKVYFSAPYEQEGQDVVACADGCYLIAGYTTNSTLYDCDIQLTKTDAVGNKLWQKSFGGSKPDFPCHMIPSGDGNFLIVGYSQSYGGGDKDIILIKVDADGNAAWTKTYGSWGNDVGDDVIATSDGNFLIVGSSNSGSSTGLNANLIKVDAGGNVIWNKQYGGGSDDFGHSVKQCSDGGFIMLGHSFSYGTNGDAYLLKTDASGNEAWYKNFGGSQYDEGTYITTNSDGSFTFLVRDSSNAGQDIDVKIIKTDGSGNTVWTKNYGGNKKDTPKMISNTSDGGYIIAAISRSFGWVNPDMWILKTNSAGDTTWTRHYGGVAHEHAYVAKEQGDGSYIVVGKSDSYGPDMDIMFLKLNSQGTLAVGVNELFADAGTIKVYPNPSNGKMKIDLSGTEFARITIKDVVGNEIYAVQGIKEEELSIDLRTQQPGIYFLRCESDKGTALKKFIIN
jgi:hypothetical protein